MCDLYIFKDECTNNKIESVSILKREANSKKLDNVVKIGIKWVKLDQIRKINQNGEKLTIWTNVTEQEKRCYEEPR